MGNKHSSDQSGFTLTELIVVISLVGVLSTVAYTFLNTGLNQYLNLQKDGTAFTDLSSQSQRLANILRGVTDIEAVAANEITVYAYFFPNNQNVSKIRYYLSDSDTILKADVTPMTANPPLGTPITGQTKTYKVIEDFYKDSASNLFTYLDASGNTLALPISNLFSIKGIRTTLAVSSKSNSSNKVQTMSLDVSLRNRKTNL